MVQKAVHPDTRLPVQALVAVADVGASLGFTRPRYQIGALVAALAVSPVAVVPFHAAEHPLLRLVAGRPTGRAHPPEAGATRSDSRRVWAHGRGAMWIRGRG